MCADVPPPNIGVQQYFIETCGRRRTSHMDSVSCILYHMNMVKEHSISPLCTSHVMSEVRKVLDVRAHTYAQACTHHMHTCICAQTCTRAHTAEKGELMWTGHGPSKGLEFQRHLVKWLRQSQPQGLKLTDCKVLALPCE